ncbi:glycerol-3-phosphate dehydrogenase/oxidase [Chryseomicrobium palamuruense]|uniref:Glycerol-3-phosphate dehydrogenase n=1 Tax=Chryseomicrobium palamuruense TaxID=682973 RepID=A0ABV8UT82_9BACL
MKSYLDRTYLKDTLDSYAFDVLVIGGGITGAGIALDAISRGLTVALIEMQDFAGGTSSRSTKLVHGGLRYLKQFEVQMVSEVGKEREIVYNNAKHVTEPEWMLLPFYKKGNFGPLSTSVGLKVYDYLAGVKKEERREMLSKQEVLQLEPLLKEKGLRGGGHYVEYRTDDARLTIEVLKKAIELGAVCLNYMKAEEFIYTHGQIAGVVAEDQLTNDKLTIEAKAVINATGPWVDNVRKKDSIDNGKHLQLTKGVHIVVDQQRFPLQQAIYFDVPDGRMIFAVPRDGKAYVGTTDTFYDQDPTHPLATKEDVSYLLNAVNSLFPNVGLTSTDVESTWAGVRPLISEEGKSASEISRKDEIWKSDSGLITIAGGKLTGYRKMAEDTVDQLQSFFTKQLPPSQTKHLPLSGGDFGLLDYDEYIYERSKQLIYYGLSLSEARHLVKFLGKNCELALGYIPYVEKWDVPSLNLSDKIMLYYTIQNEMVTSLADYFVRRTGLLYFDIQKVKSTYGDVSQLLTDELQLSEEQKQRGEEELERLLAEAEVR